jgi:AGZA family xanthine/uracil permease-like MFS transporter
MLERLFQLQARGTTVTRELRGGATTFLTMAYILLANPAILHSAGLPLDAAIASTAGAAALACLLMGFVANVPLALAPGMGLNAVVAFQIAPQLGSWQAAMGIIVLDGLVVLLLVLAGAREAILHAIPIDLRRAIGAGIGLFITFIGLVNARLVTVPPGTVSALTRDPASTLPPVTFGHLAMPETAIAFVGLVVIGILIAKDIPGAIVIGIIASTIVALAAGVTHAPSALFATPNFSSFGAADVRAAATIAAIPLLAAVIMVDFFDTLGTATAIADQAGLHDANGRIPRLRSLLAVDAISASIGGFFGASSVTAYIESAAGVAEGARTGLHTVFVGVFFALAIFLAPLFSIVPAAATAPALIVVGFLMSRQLAQIDFRNVTTGLPAFILLVMVPMTYSIAHGIGYGFITYVLINLLTGKVREVHPLMVVTAAAFGAYFLFG